VRAEATALTVAGSCEPNRRLRDSLRLLFSILLAGIDNTSGEYPVCLSDREFAYYSKQKFGDVILNVLGIYKPQAMAPGNS
jgi:hypothetical protein